MIFISTKTNQTNTNRFTVIENPSGHAERQPISGQRLDGMKRTLSMMSPDPWGADRWEVYVPSTRKTATICFPSIEGTDADILRAATMNPIIQLASPDMAQRIAREGGYFLQWLASRKVFVENVRTPVVDAYIDYLEHLSISDSVINSRIRSARAVFDTCIDCGLVIGRNVKVKFDYTIEDPPQPKRPPDACVTDTLDILFLNFNNEEIPLSMRALYFALRLIPNRISEVLAMNLNCVKYPEKGLFSVSIPTSKETPLHIPVYSDYTFFLDGTTESLLHKAICEQRDAVLSVKNDAEIDTDYLFYDSNLHRVLRIADFNQFLVGLVGKYKITNEDGSWPRVTSHALRHVAIGDRNRSGVYSLEDIMVEANHTKPETTLAYAYQSKGDEAKTLAKITSEILTKEYDAKFDNSTEPRMANPAKFKRLSESTPFVRHVGKCVLCANKNCKPLYEACVDCENFSCDPIFLDYFLSWREITSMRLERLRKAHATSDAIDFELHELEIANKYIARITGIPTTVTSETGHTETLAIEERRKENASGQ